METAQLHPHLLAGGEEPENQPSGLIPSHPPTAPAGTLLAGQTLRPEEHKGWANSSSAGPLSAPLQRQRRREALSSINSSRQQSGKAQLRRMACRNVLPDKQGQLRGPKERRRSLKMRRGARSRRNRKDPEGPATAQSPQKDPFKCSYCSQQTSIFLSGPAGDEDDGCRVVVFVQSL